MKKYMFNENELKRNLLTIIEMCKLYRKEFTAFQAVTVEQFGVIKADEYIRFMSSLPLEMFIGNQLSGLLNPDFISISHKILNGEMKFNDYMQVLLNEEGYERYKEILGL